MSILGGLARSLKQGRCKLNLWQSKNDHQKHQRRRGEDEDTSVGLGPVGQEKRKATGGIAQAEEEEEEEVGTQRFLHILEKVIRRGLVGRSLDL